MSAAEDSPHWAGLWVNAPKPPRAWQARAVPIILDALAARRRGVVVACTGAGKTTAIAEVINALINDEHLSQIVVTTPTVNLVDALSATIAERVGHHLVGRYYTHAKQWDRRVVVTCNASAGELAARLPCCSVLIADECHKTQADGLQAAVAALKPEALVGFTATPFRAAKKETLELFEEVLFRYDLRDGLADKVIVPWRVIPWLQAGVERDVAALEMLLQHAQGPTVANATTIPDAEQFAARATAMGIPALAVHSKLHPAEQKRRLDALRDGELRLVVYPSLLSEGADFPWLKTILLRRKVGAATRFIQEVGRVLRTFPGKVEAIVLDLHNLFEKFSLLNDARLGAGEELVLDDDEDDEGSRRDSPTARPHFMAPVEPVDLWAAQLRAAAEFDRLVMPRLPFLDGLAGRITDRQKIRLAELVNTTLLLPPDHAGLARALITAQAVPSSAAAGYLIELLEALQLRKVRWVPSLAVWRPNPDLGELREETASEPVYAHGSLGQNGVGVVVVRGNKTVYSDARDRDAQETAVSALVRAVLRARGYTKGAPKILVTDPIVVGLFEGRWTPQPGSLVARILEADKGGPLPRVALVQKSPAPRRAAALLRGGA